MDSFSEEDSKEIFTVFSTAFAGIKADELIVINAAVKAIKAFFVLLIKTALSFLNYSAGEISSLIVSMFVSLLLYR